MEYQISGVSFSGDTRTHVVGELYDTERSYVESLQILVEKYMKPLKSLDSNRILIDSNLVDEIFYTVPEILQHHETFLSSLQDRLSSDWDTSQVIGNVFIDAFTNQQIIDTYTAFINNWKNARQAIKIATQAKPAFERYLEAMSREHRNKLTLDALLIMPVQRIPRYELLIKELIKHTPEEHPDYGPLIEAQKEIHELALKIDCAEREMIHQEQLKDLESLIEGHVELQHPQRNFIRYDMVTILGASALTIAKKERVLFLFCDLLIMTSVKKKASRRSNLQTAFANSSNDLSLLEGSKFKLLLRVPLDQVEIRLENDQIQLQKQQQQEQQHQIQLMHQSKLIQDRKQEIEADLYTLHQMESLSSKMNFVGRTKINETINELSIQLRQKLLSLEKNDPQTIGKIHSQLTQELYTLQSPTSASTTQSNSSTASQNCQTSSTSLNNQYQQPHQTSGFTISSPSTLLATTTTTQQDSNTSLEFIISNNIPIKESPSTYLSSSSVIGEPVTGFDQGFLDGIQTLGTSLDSQQNQQLSSCETLVVTFSSIDRRQAFLQAFIEVKQQRYQMQQQRQQQQRIFSSSVTMKLAQPGSPDRRPLGINDPRRTKLQHQDNIDARLVAGVSSMSPIRLKKMLTTNNNTPSANRSSQQHHSTNETTRISSAPSGQQNTHYGSTIVHQMSAPQSLALTAVSASPIDSKERSSSQCTSCSSNVVIGSFERNHHNHHHHHQLMHQPASQPASLDTICCHEQHHNNDDDPTIQQLHRLNELINDPTNDQNHKQPQQHYQDYYQHIKQQIGSNSTTLTLNSDIDDPESISNINKHNVAYIGRINQTLLSKTAPKFIVTLPMNFLNTQHPALQFTCSTLRCDLKDVNDCKDTKLVTQKRQTVRDSSGQLWLCMSNGYVSHVALISMKKRCSRESVEQTNNQEYYSDFNASKQKYNILPIIQSAGDICKSHINCATQVKWKKRRIASTNDPSCTHKASFDTTTESNNNEKTTNEEKKPIVEVAIKAASPPVDIKLRTNFLPKTKEIQLRLSESAPSQSDNLDLDKSNNIADSSASITRLEVPSHSSKSTTMHQRGMRTGQQSESRSEVDEHNRKSMHSVICHRHYHHNHHKHLHHHHNLGHTTADDHYHPDLSYHHHHHHHQNAHHHHLYNARHNTVPIVELKRALERQHKVSDFKQNTNHQCRKHQLIPPANSPSEPTPVSPGQKQIDPLNLVRSTTPSSSYSGGKSFRSARLLRHQASLKTSSILAKLVSASKRSPYLRKSIRDKQKLQKHSDLDDNDTDTDSGNYQQQQQQQQPEVRQDDTLSIDSNILALTTPCANKCPFIGSRSEVNNSIISPLSSMSSLNSTNSSLTVNSARAGSPNHSTYDLLVHSFSTTCCACSSFAQHTLATGLHCAGKRSRHAECGLRIRSATVPGTLYQQQQQSIDAEEDTCLLTDCEQTCDQHGEVESKKDLYKVSEIIGDSACNETDLSHNIPVAVGDDIESSLWLGCDDGSLIIIECVRDYFEGNECNVCDLNQRNLSCGNVHSEIKLNFPICDIRTCKDKMVFVALSNGQLAIFSRNSDSNKDNNKEDEIWSLTNPKILTVTANELNSTSRLCLIDDNYLWYSYGRNIFVLNVSTFKLETTIMAPTNDLSLQFTMQSIAIDNMELMDNLSGVWISFKNSYLIQLYNVNNYKLLIEISLFEPINKMLSYGNEIIKQHKTACLRATSLLNVNNTREHCSTLFIGTSAGIVLYLNIRNEQLKKPLDGSLIDWNQQVASLRHGHSGHVKFLHLIEVEDEVRDQDQGQEIEPLVDNNNNTSISIDKEKFLISGGTGLDLYGPKGEQQIAYQINGDEDNLNHLILWQL